MNASPSAVSHAGSVFRQFHALTKPRVIQLIVFCALIGMVLTGCVGTIVALLRLSGNLLVNRLAWLYVHGNWPAEIDHRNGLRDDNRLSNLREVSRTLNNRNRHGARKDSGTGLIGAYRSSRPGKFRSGIHLDSGWKSLGTFDTPEAAHRAYMCAKAERDSAAG